MRVPRATNYSDPRSDMRPSTSIETFLRIQRDVERIDGFLDPINVAVWDAFLTHQELRGIPGNLMEIGVYKGKSAAILAHHVRAGEFLWLVDFSEFIEEAKVHLATISQGNVRYVKELSVLLHRDASLVPLRRSFRWIHVDGEHTGQAVSSDLSVAHELLGDTGIICLDDFFNPAYPQITASAMAFLQAHRFDLVLFACGYNKGYLARPTHARHLSALIRSSLADALHARGFSEFTLFKTAPADDFNCWGISHRFRGRDYYGLDSDPNDIC
jgi:Methyltransferase domain